MRDLNTGGKMATVDVLGEEITREEETREIAQAYRDVFAAIDEGRARLERQRQAHRARARSFVRALPREPPRRRPHGGRLRQLRADRHGGLVDDRRHAPALPRAPRGRAREPRRRPPGAVASHARRRSRRSRICGRASASARASTSSRARSRSPTTRRCARTSCAASTRSSTRAVTSESRRTTSG